MFVYFVMLPRSLAFDLFGVCCLIVVGVYDVLVVDFMVFGV